MTFRTKFFTLTSIFLLACGSDSDSPGNSGDAPPAGLDAPAPPGDNGNNNTNIDTTNSDLPVDPPQPPPTDPGTDGGSDQTDGGDSSDGGSDTTDGGSNDTGDAGAGDQDGGSGNGDAGGGSGDTDGGNGDDQDAGGPVDPPPPPTCTSFTYSGWGECVDGAQTRTVSSSSPEGCVGGNPSLSQSCVVPPPPPPTTATIGCVTVSLASVEGNTFCYQVTELDHCKDLSHWDLATDCVVTGGTPACGLVVGTDPKSGIKGVKWNTESEFESGLFCLTVDGHPSLGEVQVASKSGIPISYGTIAGPVCQ